MGSLPPKCSLKWLVGNNKVLAMTTASPGPPSRERGSHHLVIPPCGLFAKIGKLRMQVWKTNFRTERSFGSTVSALRRNGTIGLQQDSEAIWAQWTQGFWKLLGWHPAGHPSQTLSSHRRCPHSGVRWASWGSGADSQGKGITTWHQESTWSCLSFPQRCASL